MIIYPGEDSCWVAECSHLPGCLGQGRAKLMAIANIRVAMSNHIVALGGDGLYVPKERSEGLGVSGARHRPGKRFGGVRPYAPTVTFLARRLTPRRPPCRRSLAGPSLAKFVSLLGTLGALPLSDHSSILGSSTARPAMTGRLK